VSTIKLLRKIFITVDTQKEMAKHALHKCIEWFSPISLEQMNETMTLMSRKEKKFVCSEEKLAEIIEHMRDDYRILTINGLDVFTYDNVYMDTKDYEFYHKHEKGSRVRTKVRTRKYVDSGLFFFEFKQRIKKQITKYRYDIADQHHGKITMESVRFFQGIFESIYGEKFKKLLFPVLNNRYNRITLCRNSNDERVTIDFNVQYVDSENPANTYALKNVAIIESKADQWPAPSHALFDELGLKEQKACSKYCLGMHYLGKISKTDHFDKTIALMNSLQAMEVSVTKEELEKVITQ